MTYDFEVPVFDSDRETAAKAAGFADWDDFLVYVSPSDAERYASTIADYRSESCFKLQTERDEAVKTLQSLHSTARLLLAHASVCAEKHHEGEKSGRWIEDCRKDLEAAWSVIRKFEGQTR